MTPPTPVNAGLSAQEWEQKKIKARAMLLKARLYRIMGIAFGVTGLVVFLFLYVKTADGNLLDALKNPLSILIIILPFLPAAIFSFLAQRADRAFYDFMQPPDSEGKDK